MPHPPHDWLLHDNLLKTSGFSGKSLNEKINWLIVFSTQQTWFSWITLILLLCCRNQRRTNHPLCVLCTLLSRVYNGQNVTAFCFFQKCFKSNIETIYVGQNWIETLCAFHPWTEHEHLLQVRVFISHDTHRRISTRGKEVRILKKKNNQIKGKHWKKKNLDKTLCIMYSILVMLPNKITSW